MGQQVTLVGFGVTSENGSDSGTKRVAHTTISQVAPTASYWNGASGGTCYGDSGGPAFATIDGNEVQVGVTSNGATPCGTIANDTRVDAFPGWIKQTAGGDVVRGRGRPADAAGRHAGPAGRHHLSGLRRGGAGERDGAGEPDRQRRRHARHAGRRRRDRRHPEQEPLVLHGRPRRRSAHAAGRGLRRRRQPRSGDRGGQRRDHADAVAERPRPGHAHPGSLRRQLHAVHRLPSGLCAEDPDSQLHYCTEACDVSSGCPGGATCFPASGNRTVCGPPAGAANSYTGELIGTCAATPGAPALALWPVLALLLVWGARRRRR